MKKLEFEMDQKVRADHLRQNFKQLNDILAIKFKQLEDTKEATRNLVAYQKHFHKIQTQQLISENLMELNVAREDEAFMNFQKKIYNEFTEATRLEILSA